MTKVLVIIASVAIVAAAGIGLAAGFLSKDFPSLTRLAARTDPAAAASGSAQADEVSGLRTSASPEKVAETPTTTKTDKQTQYGHWIYSCADAPAGEPKKCAAQLAIRDSTRNVTIVNWLIGHNKDGELLMEITTPVDVLIAPGLKMAIGDAPARSFAYLSCAPSGCLTRLHPDDQLLADVRKAGIVKLSVDTPAGKTITFSLNVDGIGDSLDALAQP